VQLIELCSKNMFDKAMVMTDAMSKDGFPAGLTVCSPLCTRFVYPLVYPLPGAAACLLLVYPLVYPFPPVLLTVCS
jgi:hypothetical protein